MKTHLLTKKRALISSVAMLLVAIIALGTATFAWFTNNTTATAKGINVKTVEASNLQICNSKSAWSTEVAYGVSNQILYPASSANGTDWFTTEAAKRDAYDKKSTATVETVSSKYVKADGVKNDPSDAKCHYFRDQLNVKNAGEATVEDVKISFTLSGGSENYKYLRIAFAEATAQNNYSFKTGSTQTFKSLVFADNKAVYPAYKNDTPETEEITPSNVYEVSVGDLAKNQAKYYNIYVWYEGQDPDCTSDNAGKVLNDIEFTVSGTTVNTEG